MDQFPEKNIKQYKIVNIDNYKCFLRTKSSYFNDFCWIMWLE